MAHLSSGKLHQLQNCIRTLYAHRDLQTLPEHIVRTASQAIPSSVVSYARIAERNGTLAYAGVASCRQLRHLDAFVRHMHEHPLLHALHGEVLLPHLFREDIARAMHKRHPALRRSPYGTAMRISDVLADRQFRALAVFNEFFHLNGVEHQMVIGVLPTVNGYTTISCNRDKVDYSEEERLVLNLLGPHITQAYANAEDLTKAGQAFRALERANHSIREYGLTYREEDVLYWVSQGKTNAETAKILKIAPGTVKVHLERIYQKLGVENRTAASAYATGRGEKNSSGRGPRGASNGAA